MSPELYRIVIGLIVSIAAMVALNRLLNVHAFFSLLVASLVLGLIVGKSFIEIIPIMQAGFGNLLQQIGMIVALGSCLGIVMERTGAMTLISQQIVTLFGAKQSILSMSVIGLVVGIPVFCDSAFIILSRLIPAIAAQASVNPAQLALALSSGLYSSHTLVPPTPGPLAAAANFGLASQLGTVMGMGLAGSIPVSLVGYFAAKRFGHRISVETLVSAKESQLVSFNTFTAFVPLVLPIILIATSMLPGALGWQGMSAGVLVTIGQPVIALSIGLLLAAALLTTGPQRRASPAWIAEALKDAGIILLITGAGGAFGNVIKASGIDSILASNMKHSPSYGIAFLGTAFVLAAVLKTAQGSTTSAMIITSALLAPLMSSAGFTSPTQASMLVLAVGAGAMTVSHANDSYFWVVSQFSGLSPKDALRSFTVITLLQGLTGLATTIILYIVL